MKKLIIFCSLFLAAVFLVIFCNQNNEHPVPQNSLSSAVLPTPIEYSFFSDSLKPKVSHPHKQHGVPTNAEDSNLTTGLDSTSTWNEGGTGPYGQTVKIREAPQISLDSFYARCYRAGYGKNLTVNAAGRIAVVNYHTPFVVLLPEHTELAKIGEEYYSDVTTIGSPYGLGGVKLLSDLSAQASGILDINSLAAGIELQIFPAGTWGLTVPTETNSLMAVILTHQVKFLKGKLNVDNGY
jgi:hypothetical protein